MNIEIKSDLPVPVNPRRGGLSEELRVAMSSMPVGSYFEVGTESERNLCYDIARNSAKIVIITQKKNGSGWRVWRKK